MEDPNPPGNCNQDATTSLYRRNLTAPTPRPRHFLPSSVLVSIVVLVLAVVLVLPIVLLQHLLGEKETILTLLWQTKK